MKKTTLLFLLSLIFSICCLCFLVPAKAQKSQGPRRPSASATAADKIKPVPSMVKFSKEAGASFEKRELFRAATRATDADSRVREALHAGAVFEFDKSAGAKIVQEKTAAMTLALPDGQGGEVELELVRVDILAPGFTVTTSRPTKENFSDSLGVHYRGIVKGDERSLAAISVFPGEVMGFYSTESGGNSVVGRLGGDNPGDTHVLYAEQDLKATSTFECDTQDMDLPVPVSSLQDPEALLARCVRIYIEANYDLYVNKGSVANTTSYITGVFNQAAALYNNEGLPVSISQIFVWNSTSPYTGTNSLEQLEQFKAYRPTFNGDLAHLVSLQASMGGIAYVPGLCNTGATYAFSGINPTFNNVPTYSWTVEVFTHETGHNLGSRHTHACAWNGNNTAIDGCAAPQGSCAQPGLPAGGGTIMSYCHQTSVGINFSLGFGPQPNAVIVNRFNSATCISDCGGGGDTSPPNNNFAAAQVITGNTGSVSGTNVNATKETGEPNHAGNTGGTSVWYQWQAPASGVATFTTAGSNFDTLLAVYTGSNVAALTPLASNDDVASGTLTSRVTFNAVSGTTYRIAVDGYGGARGSVNLNWTNIPPAPPNDHFANALVLSGSVGTVTGTNGGATKETGEPGHGGNAGGASVWYRWQAPSSGAVTFTTVGSNFDTLLGVYTGSSVGALTSIAGNDDDPVLSALTSRVTFNAVSGTTYRIAVDGYGNASGNLGLNWNLVQTCSYSLSPTTLSVAAGGGTGSLGVTAGTGCAWTAASNSSFITISSGASGTGNGTVGFSIAANPNTVQRTGTITAAGQTFTVTQAANMASAIQLAAATSSVNESARKVLINVTRTGSTSAPASVDYATADGTASKLRDYTQTLGTLNFAAGETSKTVTVFITDDTLQEPAETFSFTLSNAAGTTLGTPFSATVTINSNDTSTGANPVGDAAFNPDFFVRQHYVDFLNREADAGGLAFWTNEFTQCGASVPCRDVKRINVSAAFFLSIEFQNTGYLVYRFYKAAYGDALSPNVPGTVPTIRLEEFLPDTQRIGQGVVVNQGSWQAQLEANKQAYALEFAQRARFLAAFPVSMTPAQYVDKLRTNTGAALTQAERDQLVTELSGNNTTAGRASVLRRVAEDQTLQVNENNRAFVLMQYFGYLRRNPSDAPEPGLNYGGWKFWLDKLNQFGGNYVAAEMVNAFITSTEYRQRFGP